MACNYEIETELSPEELAPENSLELSKPPSKNEIKFKLPNKIKSNKIKPFIASEDDIVEENLKNYNFLNLTESDKIAKDIKEMRLELKKSQEFFVNARDSLESINFENIKHRIKDLHLYPSASEIDMFGVVEKKNLNEKISKLTEIMGEKFKNHPGEFADIPEVSSFFKLCTQLDKGIDNLEKSKSDFNCLGKRIVWATNVSENRTNDIKKILHDKKNISSTAAADAKQKHEEQNKTSSTLHVE